MLVRNLFEKKPFAKFVIYAQTMSVFPRIFLGIDKAKFTKEFRKDTGFIYSDGSLAVKIKYTVLLNWGLSGCLKMKLTPEREPPLCKGRGTA